MAGTTAPAVKSKWPFELPPTVVAGGGDQERDNEVGTRQSTG
jgi:hypothetical protein